MTALGLINGSRSYRLSVFCWTDPIKRDTALCCGCCCGERYGSLASLRLLLRWSESAGCTWGANGSSIALSMTPGVGYNHR
ncbi:hypothetical protein J6590_031373 [Homalodisca vitripennis]|nr:hypothetical protein J6590_031373 [Homalodisca vitripennis]